MQTKPAILFTLCAIMLYSTHCFGKSYVVHYGTNSNALNVAFADTNLSEKAQSAIVADLNLCLQEWGKGSELRLGADDPAFVAHLHNYKRCPHYPEGIDFPDDIMETPNGLALQIPKNLSDAYTNAFKFAAANAKAFTAANAFVMFVSSTNFHNVTPKQISNYVLYNKLPQEVYEQDFAAITNDLRQQTFYLPSVLGFVSAPVGPAQNNLWMRVPYSSTPPSSTRKNWDSFSAIWHMGKWKFCIWEDNPQYNLP